MDIKQRVRGRYDTLSLSYSERYEDHFKKKYFQELEGRWISSAIEGKEFNCLLDVGTGTGRILDTVVAENKVGVDISLGMLKMARKREVADVLVEADSANLPFKNLTFDLVTAIGIFEYIQDLTPFFKEIKRTLADGGTFIFSFPNNGLFNFNQNQEYFEKTAHTLNRVREELDECELSLLDYVYTGFTLDLQKHAMFHEKVPMPLRKALFFEWMFQNRILGSIPRVRREAAEVIVKAKS